MRRVKSLSRVCLDPMGSVSLWDFQETRMLEWCHCLTTPPEGMGSIKWSSRSPGSVTLGSLFSITPVQDDVTSFTGNLLQES